MTSSSSRDCGGQKVRRRRLCASHGGRWDCPRSSDQPLTTRRSSHRSGNPAQTGSGPSGSGREPQSRPRLQTGTPETYCLRVSSPGQGSRGDQSVSAMVTPSVPAMVTDCGHHLRSPFAVIVCGRRDFRTWLWPLSQSDGMRPSQDGCEMVPEMTRCIQ